MIMNIKDIDFSNGLTSGEALHILIQHFMSDGYYTINCDVMSSNAEAVRDILNRYPEGSIRFIPKTKKKKPKR